MWFRYSYRKMARLFANSGDPDQMPQNIWGWFALFVTYTLGDLQTEMGLTEKTKMF